MRIRALLRIAFFAAVVTALSVVSASALHVGVGTVNASALRLRESADTSGKILATAPEGDVAVILEEVDGGWYKVDYNTSVGYMSAQYLDVATQADLHQSWGIVTTGGGKLHIRGGAGTENGVLTSAPDGAPLKVLGMLNGWYRVVYDGKEGYASSDYITLALNEEGKRNDGSLSGGKVSGLASQIVAEAKKYLGARYVYGGSSPKGFDCSGFTRYIYKQFGYDIPRTSSDQWLSGPGKKITSMSELQPGDLFFTNDPKYNSSGKATSHVALYIGNGQVIHASTPSTGVIITSIYENWMAPYFVGARRVIG